MRHLLVFKPSGGEISSVNVFPHADCFAVFVVEFGIGNEAVFFVKRQYAFVVLTYFSNCLIYSINFLFRRCTEAGMGLRICSMTSRAIFLSFISVGCTGLTFAAILSLSFQYSGFWKFWQDRGYWGRTTLSS
jgi:hypothetical protein